MRSLKHCMDVPPESHGIAIISTSVRDLRLGQPPPSILRPYPLPPYIHLHVFASIYSPPYICLHIFASIYSPPYVRCNHMWLIFLILAPTQVPPGSPAGKLILSSLSFPTCPFYVHLNTLFFTHYASICICVCALNCCGDSHRTPSTCITCIISIVIAILFDYFVLIILFYFAYNYATYIIFLIIVFHPYYFNY